MISLILITTTLLSLNPPDYDTKPRLRDIVTVFYEQEIIPRKVYKQLIKDVKNSRLNCTKDIFVKMERQYVLALPEHRQQWLESMTYFPVVQMSKTPFFTGYKEIPDKYRTVVDYLLNQGVIGEHCKELFEKSIFTPSDARDAIIMVEMLELIFIHCFNEFNACSP